MHMEKETEGQAEQIVKMEERASRWGGSSSVSGDRNASPVHSLPASVSWVRFPANRLPALFFPRSALSSFRFLTVFFCVR